jgi:arginyl-tRNA synthetase
VELLDEAVERAGKLIAERDNDLTEAELKEVARKVGIGAVKYADLSKNRTTDYMFNWDSMLSFEGNTAPYLQYAYTRVKSLFRKAGVDMASMPVDITVAEKQEHALAVLLLQFEEVIGMVSREATPHVLCTYLYDVASAFMTFYEACPMLKDGIEPQVRDSRLALSALVAKTLEQGLTLLGIETLEKM